MDFQKYYNESEEYKNLREDYKIHKTHINSVINWKLKYLSKFNLDLDENSKILEVGCAAGDLIANFNSSVKNSNRYGIDISDKNIDFAKKSYPEINFSTNSLVYFIVNNIHFDLIILSDILEHVENDLDLLLKTSLIGKFILVNLPLEKCWEFKTREYGPNDFRGHLRAYDIYDAQELVKKADLKQLDYMVKYYVKEQIFRDYLKNKLYRNKKLFGKISGFFKYIFEIIEINIRLKRYKSNYFALLTPNKKNINV